MSCLDKEITVNGLFLENAVLGLKCWALGYFATRNIQLNNSVLTKSESWTLHGRMWIEQNGNMNLVTFATQYKEQKEAMLVRQLEF